jgi:ABC-type nitrate/sulfonate/bicarbonate transport system substrate-binding protein
MREQDIDLTLVRESSWASLRDHLNLGHVDCAHALAPLPIAAALGVGQVRTDSVVPFVLGRGGNAFTLSNELADAVQDAASADTASSASALASAIRMRGGAPLTFAMVYPFSGHNYELRYWLADAGLHPDRDVRLVAIPPPLMVESLRAGHVDGFCVGEPWNSLAVDEGIGRIVVTKSQIFPRGIEKVLAVRPSIAADEEALGRLIRGLHAAARWCDESRNRAELALLLARPEYVHLPAELIERSLAGRLDIGGGRTLDDPDFLHFHRYDANLPRRAEAVWLYAQMARWGQLRPSPDLARRAAEVFRSDLYRRALGLPDAMDPAMTPPFDDIERGDFGVASYVERFDLRTPFVESPFALQS